MLKTDVQFDEIILKHAAYNIFLHSVVQEHECIRILNTMRWETSTNYICKVFLMLGGKSTSWYFVSVYFHVFV